MIDELIGLEQQGWEALSSTEPVEFCSRWPSDDALIIVPGMVIDRSTFLDAVAHEQTWSTHNIEDPMIVRLTETSAALVWQLALHQQTVL